MNYIKALFKGLDKKDKRNLVLVLSVFSFFVFALFIIAMEMVVFIISKPRIIDPALNCTESNVAYIKIIKEHEKVRSYLTDETIVLTDPSTISNVCNVLKSVKHKPFGFSHPIKKWSCVMIIKTANSKFSLFITETKNRDINGTIVRFFSNVTWGWRIAQFKSEQLGPLLEETVPFLNENF